MSPVATKTLVYKSTSCILMTPINYAATGSWSAATSLSLVLLLASSAYYAFFETAWSRYHD